MTVPPHPPGESGPGYPGHTGYPYGYSQPGHYPGPYGPPRQPTNAMAIIALVGSLIFAPLGIIFGHISLSQIKRTGEEGRGLAIAGLVIGYVMVVLYVLILVLAVILIAAVPRDSGYERYERPGISYTASAPYAAEVTRYTS